MKVQITGGELNAAAAWTARIAPSNPRAPVMAGVSMAAADGLLSLAATDYDTFGTVSIDAKVDDEGHAVVSARLLAAVAKTLRRDDEVTLTRSEGDSGLTVRCGRASWVLPCMDAADWPTFPQLGDPVGKVSAADLSRALTRVLPAVGPPDAKPPELAGVAFDFGDVLTLVATDRYRMAAAEVSWQPALDIAEELMIVPVDLLNAAMSVAGTGEIELLTDGSTFGVVCPRHQVTGRLIAGRYPVWREYQTLPDVATTVTIDVAELAHAVTQVSAVANLTARAPDLVRLDFAPDAVAVTLASELSDADGNNGTDVHSFTGDPVTAGINPRYLLDALAGLDSPLARFEFPAGPVKRFLVRPAGKDGSVVDGYSHLLMACRLPSRSR